MGWETVSPLETQPIESRDLLPQDVLKSDPIVTISMRDLNNSNVLPRSAARTAGNNLVYHIDHKHFNWVFRECSALSLQPADRHIHLVFE